MSSEGMFDMLGVCPGLSSQTTTLPADWPQDIEIAGRIVVDSLSFYADNFVIRAPRKRTWNEIMEKVLDDRSALWERLAAL